MTDTARPPRTARRLPRIVLALLPLVWVLSHVTGGPGWDGIDRLDALMQDARLRVVMARPLDPRIVIVDIDDKSQAEVGRWPWRRDHLARLVDELFDRQQVTLVGFGQVFDTSDDSSGLTRLRQLADQELREVPAYAQRLRAIEASLDHDGQFAKALRERPVVLGFHLTRDPTGRTSGVLPAPAMPSDSLNGRSVGLSEWTGYSANIERLATAAPVAGFLHPLTDVDGRVRSVPLLASHGGQYHEALGLAMYRVLLGGPAIEPRFHEPRFPDRYDGLAQLHLRHGPTTVSVPVGNGVTARLPFRGPGGANGGAFRYVSAADLLAGRVPPSSLQGKLILVGATAAGLDPTYATPVGAHYPAIELHATLLSGLIDGRLPVRPNAASGYGLLVLLGVGLLMALALPTLSFWRASLLLVAVIAGIVGLNLWLSVMAGLSLPLAPALVAAVASFALSMTYGYAVEGRARRDLARLFGTYVPPEVVQQLVDDPQHDSMQATNRHLTVMFCDIRGFTRLSEGLEPAALQSLLNRVLSRLTDVIRRHDGTIDKYIGDCVMAFWGAPLEMPNHARRAVEAALDLSQAVRLLNEEHRAQGLPEIEVGIGLNSGLMCVGDMGSPLRRAYTVVGDAVNLAARLEHLSGLYGVTVVAGESTRREADDLTWLELDKVLVKGKARAVAVYTPWAVGGEPDQATTDQLRTWSAFLKAYRAQDVASSERLMAGVAPDVLPKPLHAMYAQRVAAMRGQPFDPAWDGATPVDGA